MNPESETVSNNGVLGNEYDSHAEMNAESTEFRTDPGVEVTTIDGGAVSLNVSRTFLRDPRAPRWQISIFAEDVDDPENMSDVSGHLCRCGDLHEHAGDGDDIEIITLTADAAVRLAHEILRLAEPLSDGPAGN